MRLGQFSDWENPQKNHPNGAELDILGFEIVKDSFSSFL